MAIVPQASSASSTTVRDLSSEHMASGTLPMSLSPLSLLDEGSAISELNAITANISRMQLNDIGSANDARDDGQEQIFKTSHVLEQLNNVVDELKKFSME